MNIFFLLYVVSSVQKAEDLLVFLVLVSYFGRYHFISLSDNHIVPLADYKPHIEFSNPRRGMSFFFKVVGCGRLYFSKMSAVIFSVPFNFKR